MPTADKTKAKAPAADGQDKPVHVRPKPIEHAQVTTDQERREMLLWLIDTHGGGVTAAARNSGISRVHLEQIISGMKNPLRMQQETIEKLLTVLNLPDTQAWELLGIPQADRKRWRTLRPPPMGHGDVIRSVTNIELDQPLAGDISIPAGYMISVDRNVANQGVIVARLAGRYYATKPDAIPPSAEVLGRLISIDMVGRAD